MAAGQADTRYSPTETEYGMTCALYLLLLNRKPGSVCGPHCCAGWDQVGDTCQPHCYHPCEHGTCVDTNVCECDPGWEGADCRHDIDECWYGQHACHHNCHNHEGCYTCFCDDGFQLINSTHCVASNGNTTVEPPLMTTASDSLCVTTIAATVGTATATANPQQTTTRTTTSGIRNTALTTAADVTTARRPQIATSTAAPQTSSTAPTTAVDVTTTRRSQDVTTDEQP
ncbi:protein NEL-like [Branchiostoma floridae]|uniref:Protein NEL-like n=1 Tax=Branchiostoma floridae TaxID=7739 RepID=A0A9J7LRA9_BRAFL|nr:protein NEL-like [Branchiostoma floridae]